MSKYSVIKKVIQSIPGLREWLATLFTKLPDSISPITYKLMRRSIFRDNDNREAVFNASVGFLIKSGASNLKYLEFGVARGTSVIMADDIAKKFGISTLPIYAFDSFQGLPSGEGGVFDAGDMSYSKEKFMQFISKAGVDSHRVTTVSGFFNNTLTSDTQFFLGLTPGSYLIHIDCDLYSSTVDILRFLKPLLLYPSVIIFDDWFSFDEKPNPQDFGEQCAFNEWSRRSEFFELASHSNWNICFATKVCA